MRFFYFLMISFLVSTSWAQNSSDGSEIDWKDLHLKPVLERATDQTSLFLWIGGVTSVVLTERQDDHIRLQFKNHQKMSKDMSHAGDLMGSGLLGLTILAAQYGYDKNRDNWQSHARTLVYSTLVSSTMKVSFGRQRPGNSDSYHSFPSGHSTTAFATATAMAYSYGWKAALVAYPIAAWVGVSRLSDDVHWGSDVVAGAFIGFWTARASSYSTAAISNREYSRFNIMPQIDHNYFGFQFIWN